MMQYSLDDLAQLIDARILEEDHSLPLVQFIEAIGRALRQRSEAIELALHPQKE